MVRAIVRKEGDRTFLEISDEVSNIGELEDGQEIQLSILSDTPDDLSIEEFDETVERLIAENREALDYLAQ